MCPEDRNLVSNINSVIRLGEKQMKRMPKLILMLLIIILGCISSVSSIKASETTEGIAINEENFPDSNVRNQLWQWVDQNGDYVLQPSEIEKTKWFSVSGWGDDTKDGKDYTTINCTGLECLKNVERITIAPAGIATGTSEILNFEKLYQLKKLKQISLEGSFVNRTYDFSQFKNLRELTLEGINANKIIVNNAKLKAFKISSVKSKALVIKKAGKVKNIDWTSLKTNELNLSKIKNLKKVDIDSLKAKKIKFGKLSKLTKVTIVMDEKAGKNTLKKLDLSGVKNLESFRGGNFAGIQEIKFGKLKKLKIVDIYFGSKSNKKLKFLDLSGLKNLRSVAIENLKKVKSIKFRKNQKLKDCYIINCKELKKLDMNGSKVSKIIRVDKWTKVIHLNSTSKKNLKYNK